MTPQDLAREIYERVLLHAGAHGHDVGGVSIDDVVIERPKNREHGDWATTQ